MYHYPVLYRYAIEVSNRTSEGSVINAEYIILCVKVPPICRLPCRLEIDSSVNRGKVDVEYTATHLYVNLQHMLDIATLGPP